jgi:hypothetical protein
MYPRYIMKYSDTVTDWRRITEIIQQGKHPTNNALAMAFAGSKPLPSLVRGYLADRFESGWPRGGRTKTPWEKRDSMGLNWRDEDCPSSYNLEQSTA